MNKESFMQELARLLGDISPQERQEALNFYEEYFHDAGPEKEQEVLKELGSPMQVAAKIKEGLDVTEEPPKKHSVWKTIGLVLLIICYMCIPASACICQCDFIPADCLVFRADFFDSGIRCGCPDLCALRHCLRGDGIYLYVFFSVCVPDYGGQRTYLYGDRHTVYDAYGVDVCIRPAGMLQGHCLGMEKNLRKEAGMKNWLKGERASMKKQT